MLLVSILLFIPCPGPAQDEALYHAEQFYRIHNYEQAVTEYKRFLFFNEGNDQTGDIFFRLGEVYRENGEFNQAIDAIRESISRTYNDSLKDERRISLSCLYLARADYGNAEFELLRVAHFSDYPALKEKAFFFLAVRYIYSYDWIQTERALQNAGTWCQPDAASFEKDAQRTGYKSVRLARWLSTFLPGAGQAYCGDWRNGLNAFALNGLLVYVMTDALLNLRYLDMIETYGYLRRYYTGNRDNSAMIARAYNSETNAAQSGKILETLYQGAMEKENQMDINMGHSEIRKTSP